MADADSGKKFQLKPSILSNSLKRRLKAGDVDRENFGEVIASCIGRELSGEDCVPEVSLVYDKTKGRSLIASKYLEGDKVRTLDMYAIEKGVTFKRHVRLVVGEMASDGEMAVDSQEISSLKASLAKAIVISAALGDHDVNPGNMMVITSGDTSHIARIDFGHAFNDLLNALSINGGRLRNKKNPMMDFFNREEVAGLGGDVSKLWRDYPGMVPSRELVDALNALSTDSAKKIKQGINQARREFHDLLNEMIERGDEKGIEHVYKTLQSIHQAITGKKLDLPITNMEQVLRQTFKQFGMFVSKNCDDAVDVARLMQQQLDIDDALKMGDQKSLQAIINKHQNDKPRTWVKMVPHAPAFHGGIESYIHHRQLQLMPLLQQESSEHAYSVVLLALTMLACAVLFVALPIAFILAGVAIGLGLLTIGRMSYDHYKASKALNTSHHQVALENDLSNDSPRSGHLERSESSSTIAEVTGRAAVLESHGLIELLHGKSDKSRTVVTDRAEKMAVRRP